jgi:tetratricopeptide (TPR) repeat protein
MKDEVNEALLQRSRAAQSHGAGLLDAIYVSVSCKRCNRFLDDPTGRQVTSADYRDLDALIERVLVAAREIFAEPPIVCRLCGTKTQTVAVDYHAWHTGTNRDLVIRAAKRPLLGIESELLWWDEPHGFASVGTLRVEDREHVRRDACFRRIGAAIARAGVRAALGAIEEALTAFPGDPDLLRVLPELLAAGKVEVVAQITRAHVNAHPDDANGHFWMANAITQQVKRGLADAAQLVEAENHLGIALEKRPDFMDAELALCALARARNQLDEAEKRYVRALKKNPKHLPLLLEFGTFMLDRDAVVSLELFERAVMLAPQDPAPLFGQARALIYLGRVTEADVLLDEARPAHGADPRLQELETLLLRLRRPPKKPKRDRG